VEKSAPVAVISEAAAHRYWPAADPLGQRFQLDLNFQGTMSEFEVIGYGQCGDDHEKSRKINHHYLRASVRQTEVCHLLLS
jgi:hypothetical protein